MGQLDGKVAIVTGTSRGVGVGIAHCLLEAGAAVAGCSRRPLDTLPGADGIPGAAQRSVQWVCDQSDWAQIDGFVGRVVDHFGQLDILVNNAGGTMPVPHAEAVPELIAKISGTPAGETPFGRNALFHAFAVQNNLISPLWFALRAYETMAGQDQTGSIVNISSGASHSAGSPTLVSYGAAKAGLNHLTRSLAEEWGPRVRVNCLALGPTMTDSFRSFVLPADDPEGRVYFGHVPLGRAGTPEEVGAACVFLCSGQADYINGTTIEIDGGMLPGVLYDAGLRTIEDLLETAERKPTP
jgi:NAD(P)-dependent dehydrogenase (short-subunit alcohol dehydrogenase family)